MTLPDAVQNRRGGVPPGAAGVHRTGGAWGRIAPTYEARDEYYHFVQDATHPHFRRRTLGELPRSFTRVKSVAIPLGHTVAMTLPDAVQNRRGSAPRERGGRQPPHVFN